MPTVFRYSFFFQFYFYDTYFVILSLLCEQEYYLMTDIRNFFVIYVWYIGFYEYIVTLTSFLVSLKILIDKNWKI